MAVRLGREIEYVIPERDMKTDRAAILEQGKADITISAYTITDERKKRVDFSRPYFSDGLGMMITQDSFKKGTIVLAGKTVLAFSHTTAYAWLKKINDPSCTIIPGIPLGFKGGPVEMLRTGRIYAYIIDWSRLQAIALENKDMYVLPKPLTKEDWGIAVKKGNKTLLDKINAALIALEKDGALARLKKKWLGTAGNNKE